jgi:hypothetical protein
VNLGPVPRPCASAVLVCDKKYIKYLLSRG